MSVASSSADMDDSSMSGGDGGGSVSGNGKGGNKGGDSGLDRSGGGGNGSSNNISSNINIEKDNAPDESNSLTQWGQSAGGVNPAAMEFVPFVVVPNESPTMSPQFSAMKPADNAEFNVVSFPGRSLMGASFEDVTGSRSLLQSGDSSMLQQPFQHHLLHHSGQQTSMRVSGNESTSRPSNVATSDGTSKKNSRRHHPKERNRNKKKSNNRGQGDHRKKEGGGDDQQQKKKEKKQRSRKKLSQSQQSK
jgi:hypothetical protein